ncbi:MAG: VOC family protein, partial [Actinomycetes bacterium]
MDWKIELLPIPVTDVDRAKRFYADQLGFVVDLDHQITETIRIVQLTPPGSACSVMLGAGASTEADAVAPGSVQGVQIVVDDVEAARSELDSRGVQVSPVRR